MDTDRGASQADLIARHSRAELVEMAYSAGVPISGTKSDIAGRIASAGHADDHDDHGYQDDYDHDDYDDYDDGPAIYREPSPLPPGIEPIVPAYPHRQRYTTIPITVPAELIRRTGSLPAHVATEAANRAVTDAHEQGYAYARRPRRTATVRLPDGGMRLDYEVAIAPPRRLGRR